MDSSRGQATTEYVGAILLVALILVTAAVAVTAPGVPKAVVTKLRLGLCIVADDVCSTAAAERRGLEPCLLSTEEHARDNGGTLLFFHAGGSDFWSAERRSDGTVVLTEGYGQDVDAGPSAGLHVGPAEAGGSASAGIGFRSGRSWVLSDARLQEVLRASKGDPTRARFVLEAALGEPSASFVEGGGRTGAELAVDAIRSIPGAGEEARTMLGRRHDREGTTYYADLGSGSTGMITDAVPSLAGSGHLAAEYRTGAPPAITLRTTARPGSREETETVMRLSLAEPEDRALAQRVAFVALHDPALALRDLVARIKDRGTVERLHYRTDEDTSGWEYELGLGAGIGIDHATRSLRRRLLAAEVINGRLPASREDCLALGAA